MPLVARILLALALTVGCAGCAFFGSLVHGGTVAVGAAAGGAVGGPAGAAVGGIVGFYGGDLASEQLTGTRSVRIDAAGKVQSPSGNGSLSGAISQAAGIKSMTGFIWVIAIAVFVWLGGIGWLRKVIADRDKAKAGTDEDRVAHKARTAELEAEVKRLREKDDRTRIELDELWEKVTQRPLQP